MKCSRCSLELARGSAHVSPEGCVEALQEALEKAKTCAACQGPVETTLHPGCVPAEVLNRGAKLGTKVLEQRVTEWLAQKLAGGHGRGRPHTSDDDEQDVDPMDRDQRRSSRGSSFEP